MKEDNYWSEPEGTFEERRQAYLEFCAAQSPGGRTGFFSQIARLELGHDVDEAPFHEALAVVDSRVDCCDFSVGGLLRILYLYHDSPHISKELISAIEERILNFKYWWDEEKGDNRRCYWTENHQIIFHSDELLAAQLFPQATFSNSGQDAIYHTNHALHLIRRWFDFRARFGFIEIADAPEYGLSFDDLEDGHLYWSIQDYIHEAIYDLAQQTRRAFGIMLYEDYLQRYYQVWNWQVEQYGRIMDRNIDCHGMTEVHIQTYRTSHYMLSCAQSYRPGKPGYQQHPWQATLGIDAVVFTNHPGADDETSRPNFWAGNGILPRVAQHENVLICIHYVPADDPFPFSHAYFPRDAFDEVIEAGQWVFGRQGKGYIGLYSQHPPRWLRDQHDDAQPIIELRADAPANVWIVEMGDEGQWGSLANFVTAVSEAPVEITELNVSYQSPTIGLTEFGWHGPLRVDGDEVNLHDYPRFNNPYCQADFTSRQYTIRHGEKTYTLDFDVDSLEMFSDDFMETRNQPEIQKREDMFE